LGPRRFRLAIAEQAPEKAGGVGRFRAGLLHLLLKLSDLRPGLIERNVLHKDCLGHDVERIEVSAEGLIEQCFGFGIFFLQLSLVYPLDERVEKLFFLGSH
jgi:hypothetical protein